MSFKAKLLVTSSVGILVLAGVLFLAVFRDDDSGAQPEPPVSWTTDVITAVVRESKLPVTPEVSPPTNEETEKSGLSLSRDPTWTLKGRVVGNLYNPGVSDPAAFVAVQGAVVSLQADPWYKFDPSIKAQKLVTDAEGHFEFQSAPQKTPLSLVFDEKLFALRSMRLYMPALGDKPTLDLGDVVLYSGSTVRVLVTDSEDQPVEGAEVRIKMSGIDSEYYRSIRSASPGLRKSTDKGQGLYVLERVPTGQGYLQVDKKGYATTGNVSFESPLPRDRDPFEVKLEVGHSIGGRVVDQSGAAIENVEIECEKRQARTDKNGYFEVQNVREGTHRITATREGFVTTRERYVRAGRADLRLRMIREARVKGRVISEVDGSPVAAAKISVSTRYKAPHCKREKRSRGISDEQGYFLLNQLTKGEYQLLVQHEKFAFYAGEATISLETGAEVDLGTIELGKGVQVRGHVFEADGETPVSGANVSFLWKDKELRKVEPRDSTTDENGKFSIPALFAGEYEVKIESRGFFNKEEDVELDANQELSFTLERGAYIAGRVVDAEGEPIAGATVRPDVNRFPGDNLSRKRFRPMRKIKAKTDSEGKFELSGLEAHPSYSVHARHSEYAPNTVTGIQLEPRVAVKSVEVQLFRGGTIQGRVVDNEGKALAGIRVRAKDEKKRTGLLHADPLEELMTISTRETDEDGTFSLSRLPEGLYTVLADPKRTRPELISTSLEKIDVTDEQISEELVLTLEVGAVLRGKVVDPAGEAVPRADVLLSNERSYQTKTDAEGQFELIGISDGPKNFTVRKSGYNTDRRQVSIPTEEVMEVTLSVPSLVTGLVVAADGKPFKELRVVAHREKGGLRRSASGSREGDFEIELAPGDWTLLALAKGYLPGESEKFTLGPDQVLEDLEITVDHGLEISGVVVDRATSEPIRGAVVGRAASRVDDRLFLLGRELSTVTTDAEGAFTLGELPHGKISVRAAHPNYAQVLVQNVELSAGGGEELRIEMGTGGILRGEVTRGGAPLTEMKISVDNQNPGLQPRESTHTDDQGRYEFKGLASGEYRLRLEKSDDDERIATVRDGEVTEYDVELVPPVTISGVIRAGGRAISGGRVWLADKMGKSNEFCDVDVNGLYSAVLSSPGAYSMIIVSGTDPNQSGIRVDVDVPEGLDFVERDVDLPSAKIVGVVVDAETGDPVSQARVKAIRSGARLTSVKSIFLATDGSGSTDPSGHFVVPNLAPGKYSVRIISQSHSLLILNNIKLGDSLTDLGEVALNGGVGFVINVKSEDGKPLSGASATLRDTKGNLLGDFPSALSDNQGVLELANLEPDVYRLTVAHRDFSPSTVLIRPGEGTSESAVKLDKGGTIEVQVLDDGGNEVKGAEVRLLDGHGHNVLVDITDTGRGFLSSVHLTNGGGRVKTDRVGEGKYLADARFGNVHSEMVEVMIVRDKSTKLTLSLSEDGNR